MSRLGRILTSRTWAGLAIAFSVVGSVTAKMSLPVYAIPGAGHDDGLFVALADELLNGNWLGPYSGMTLAKGPIYPMFMASSHALGIPLKLAEHLVFLMACALASWTVFRLSNARTLGLLVFIALVLHPLSWTSDHQRVLRDHLYLSLCLGLICLGALLFLGPPIRRSLTRTAAFAALGFLFGTCWLTREEGIWLYPTFAIFLIGAAYKHRSKWFRTRIWPSAIRTSALYAVVIGAGFTLIYAPVLILNYTNYGIFRTNELRGGAFPAAYGAIMRVVHKDFKRYIVYPADAAQAVYAASPAARELRPFLDTQSNQGWRTVGCKELQIDPCPVGIAGGWFVWALRQGASELGYFESAKKAEQFFGRMASEINASCESGKTDCTSQRSSMTTPFRWDYLEPFVRSYFLGMRRLLSFGYAEIQWRPDKGTFAEDERFSRVVGLVPITNQPDQRITVQGWVAAPDDVPVLQVVDPANKDVSTIVETTDAPDVERHFASQQKSGMKALRFSIKTTCREPTCVLSIRDTSETTTNLPLNALKAPGGMTIGSSVLYLSVLADGAHVYRVVDQQAVDDLNAQLSRFGLGYTAIFAPLGILAIPLVLLAFLRTPLNTPAGSLLITIVGLVVGIGLRIALLAFIDVSSFQTFHTSRYLAAASPLLVIVSLCGCYLGLRTLPFRRQWREPATLTPQV